MNRDIERLLPDAIAATQAFLMNEQQQVLGEYDGYAASLGAAIRTSGLVPAMVFYTDTSRSDGEARRYKLLQAIAFCLGYQVDTEDNRHQRLLLDALIEEVYGKGATTPIKRPDRNRSNTMIYAAPKLTLDKKALRKWTKQVLHASIALKLAMRNFPHSDDHKTDEHAS